MTLLINALVWNSCTGKPDWEPPRRCSQDDQVKGHGHDLLELCKTTGLYVANGRVFKGEGKYTRDGSTGRSVVDYLLMTQESSAYLVDFKVDNLLP